MTIHQFFIKRSQISPDMEVRLGGADAHHIRSVLRLRKDARLRLIDEEQTSHLAVLEKVGRSEVRARIIDSTRQERSHVSLVVVQGIPRLTKTDLITEKLTELGVARIIFTPMKYTPYSDAIDRISKRLVRLQRIAEAAAKQSGRLDIPDVAAIADLETSLKTLESGTLILVADESVSARGLRERLKTVRKESRQALVVGPEGGFSPQERRLLSDIGAISFSLGATILRTETAAIVAAALLLYESGDI